MVRKKFGVERSKGEIPESKKDVASDPSRATRIRLPAFISLCIGQIVGADPEDFANERIRDLALQLIRHSEGVASIAQTLANPVIPIGRRRWLPAFRRALDTLANHLIRNYGSYSPGYEGEVQPPINFPMVLQDAVIHIAEAAQAMQDWDARQPCDSTPDVLPDRLAATLESQLAILRVAIPSDTSDPRPPGLRPSLTPKGKGRKPEYDDLVSFIDTIPNSSDMSLKELLIHVKKEYKGKIPKTVEALRQNLNRRKKRTK